MWAANGEDIFAGYHGDARGVFIVDWAAGNVVLEVKDDEEEEEEATEAPKDDDHSDHDHADGEHDHDETADGDHDETGLEDASSSMMFKIAGAGVAIFVTMLSVF